MRACAIIPTYDNEATLAEVVARVRRHLPDVVVVDDGSAEPARRVAEELRAAGACALVVRPRNGGKGAAVKDGLAWAQAHGFDHALQIDADLQHDAEDIPRLLGRVDAARPTLVLAQPAFDASVPRGRLVARQISVFWAMVETLSRRVGDPLCGFRVYPVAEALRARARGDAMDFDPEIAVRLVWSGVAVEKVASRVVYVPGGVSHYRGLRDTLLISLAHARLCVEGLLRLLAWPFRRLLRGRS